MTWTRLSDTFPTDPRLLECSRDARLLHVEALVYCNQHLTNGVLPHGALLRITDSVDPETAVAELESAGFWVPVADRNAWQLEWKDQEPAAEVEERRAMNAARQARFRDRTKRHGSGDHSRCDSRFCAAAKRPAKDSDDPTRNALRNASHNALVTPSRPVPSRPLTGTGTEGGALAEKSERRAADDDARREHRDAPARLTDEEIRAYDIRNATNAAKARDALKGRASGAAATKETEDLEADSPLTARDQQRLAR